MKVKTRLALVTAKTAKKTMQLLKRKGTHLPGEIAEKIDHHIIENITKPKHKIAVTGTNGKTTTTNMISDLISSFGYRYISNRLGSNTYFGITSCLLDGNTLFGKNTAEYGLFEVDEVWSPFILPELKPDSLTITNLFQDSFERNGNIYFIFNKLEKAIPDNVKLILNANDSISSFIKPENPRVYFAVENIFNEQQRLASQVEDLNYCPKCGHEIVWDYKRYHHIGQYHCEHCDFKMPNPTYLVKEYLESSNEILIVDHQEEVVLPLVQKTIEGVYNQIAAYATLRENGFDIEMIKQSMSQIEVVSSRFATMSVKQKEIINMVAKGYNPVANSRVFDTIGKTEGPKSVIYCFDNLETNHVDVRTPGWMSSIDFKYLLNDLNKLIFRSRHANEFLVTALLQGIPKEKIVIVDQMDEIVNHIDPHTQETIFILHDIEDKNIAQANAVQDLLVNYLKGAN